MELADCSYMFGMEEVPDFNPAFFFQLKNHPRIPEKMGW